VCVSELSNGVVLFDDNDNPVAESRVSYSYWHDDMILVVQSSQSAVLSCQFGIHVSGQYDILSWAFCLLAFVVINLYIKYTSECPWQIWSPLPSLGHIWDAMLVRRKGNIKKNCLCVTVLCTVIMVHKGTSSSYRLVDCVGLWSCLV